MTDLLAVCDRDTADAQVRSISLDRRFATAYGAALQLATIVLAASGYRVAARRGHHAVTFQALSALMGEDLADLAVYFDSCRALRNQSDYDRAGIVSEADVDELLRELAYFRRLVLEWVERKHPTLLP